METARKAELFVVILSTVPACTFLKARLMQRSGSAVEGRDNFLSI